MDQREVRGLPWLLMSYSEMKWDWVCLNNENPIDLMNSADGIKRVESVLGRIAYGIYS